MSLTPSSIISELSRLTRPSQAGLRVAWDRRRAAPGQPAPPLSLVYTTIVEEDPHLLTIPYPFFYLYNTREQALAETTLRKRSKEGFVPPPLPI